MKMLFARQTQAVRQPSEAKPQTKVEAFLSSKGTVVVKDFYELGKVGGLRSGLSMADCSEKGILAKGCLSIAAIP
jgi:hypothetical protein